METKIYNNFYKIKITESQDETSSHGSLCFY